MTPARERVKPLPELRSVALLGHRVRVSVRHGTSEAPPLLVCNGIGASLEVLDRFVAELDPAIEVVRFDVPGVGGSGQALLPYRFSGLAWFVNRLMDELGYDEYATLGISWGGGLAQQIALQSPRRCRRLVLVSTATGAVMVPTSPRVLLKMATPRRYTDVGYATAVASELYGGRLRSDPDLVRSLLHHGTRLTSRTGYLFQLLAGAGWTSLPLLPLIRQPTLILAGDDDPIIPLVNARVMRRLMPRADLHVFPDGHLGLVTMAEDLGPRVSDFLLERNL